MTSTIIQPVADQLGTIANGIGLTPTVTAWVWEPRELGNMPAAVIRVPRVTRKGVEEAESQLGATDWMMRFPVDLFFDLAEPIATQKQAADYLEKWVAAIDADTSLGSLGVLDAKVVSAEPAFYEDRPRPTMAYETQLELLRLV